MPTSRQLHARPATAGLSHRKAPAVFDAHLHRPPPRDSQTVIEMASRGLRCICLTAREYPLHDAARPADFFADPERVDDGLTALAIVGIKDPVR